MKGGEVSGGNGKEESEGRETGRIMLEVKRAYRGGIGYMFHYSILSLYLEMVA